MNDRGANTEAMQSRSITAARMGVCAALLCIACGGPPPPPTLGPTERATIRDDESRAGTIMVALRITLDSPSDSDRVHLHAITYDMDGQETSTDLGHYVGTVMQQPSLGTELVRVAIEHAGGRRAIRLMLRDGELRAEEITTDGDDETGTLIQRIPLPPGVDVRPSERPVENPR